MSILNFAIEKNRTLLAIIIFVVRVLDYLSPGHHCCCCDWIWNGWNFATIFPGDA